MLNELVRAAYEKFDRSAPLLVTDWALDGDLAPVESLTLSVQRTTPELLPEAVSIALSDASVMVLPTWGSKPASRERNEVDWIASLPAPPAHVLGVLLPDAVLSGRRTARLWDALQRHGLRPLIVLTFSGAFLRGVHSGFQCSLVLFGDVDSAEPLRMFRLPRTASRADVVDDFQRLLKRQGGQSKYGFVVRDPVSVGDPLRRMNVTTRTRAPGCGTCQRSAHPWRLASCSRFGEAHFTARHGVLGNMRAMTRSASLLPVTSDQKVGSSPSGCASRPKRHEGPSPLSRATSCSVASVPAAIGEVSELRT